MRVRVTWSCFTHSLNTNGPVPMGAAQFSSMPRASPAGDSIASQVCASDSCRALSGSDRVKRAVCGSTAVTDATLPSARMAVDDAVSGSFMCSMFATTASASKGVPSVNDTSERRATSTVSPSSETVEPVASHGTISPFSSCENSDSSTLVPTRACGMLPPTCGSRQVGSPKPVA